MKTAVVVVLNSYTHDSRVERQVEALRKRGYFTYVFALHEKGLASLERHPSYEVRRFQLLTRPLPKHKLVHVLKYVECVVQMCRAAWRANPDLIHANDLDALPIGYLSAKLRSSRLIYDAHELWVGISGQENFHPAIFALGRWLEATLARRADHVITVSGCIAEHMARDMNISRPTVIRNISATPNRSVLHKGRLRSDIGVSPDTSIVLYLGMMVPGRGLETAIRALYRVTGPAVLVLMGQCSDSYRNALARLSEQLMVEHRLFFLDPVPPDDVVEYAADATIGIAPIEGSCLSYRYSLSNKLFQYLQAGLPIVVSDLPEMASLVAQYGVGETFPDRDERALAETLNDLLSSPEKLAYLGRKSLRSSQELSWEREEQRLLNIYDEVDPRTGALPGATAPQVEVVE